MKKVTVALALMMSVGLTGCANTDRICSSC